MPTKPSEGVSVLASLSKRVQEQAPKTKPTATLTALPNERNATSPIPNTPGLGSLAEDPDIILGRLADAEREVRAILASIHRLQITWGQPEVAEAERAEVDQKLLDKEADRRAADRERAAAGDAKAAAREEVAQSKADLIADVLSEPTATFDQHYKNLQEDAQAAVYTQPEPLVVDGWRCPEHPNVEPVVLTSKRRNAKYRACPEHPNQSFEKL